MGGNFHKFADDNGVTGPEVPGGLSFVPNSLNKPTPLGPLMVLSPEYHRRYWYKYELSRETVAIFKSLDRLAQRHPDPERLKVENEWAKTEDKGDETFAEFIGAAFKFVLWPFFLAVSLGLRLTKVSADVTGWARSP
jgi:hypothetical protein